MPKKRAKKKPTSAKGIIYFLLVLGVLALGVQWFAFGRAGCMKKSLASAKDAIGSVYEIAQLRKEQGVDRVIVPAVGTDNNSVAVVQMADGNRLSYRITVALPRADQGALIKARKMRDQMYDATTSFMTRLKLDPRYVPKPGENTVPPYYLFEEAAGIERVVTLQDIQSKILSLLAGVGMSFVKGIYFPVFRIEIKEDVVDIPAVGADINAVNTARLADGNKLTYRIAVSFFNANAETVKKATALSDRIYSVTTGFLSQLRIDTRYQNETEGDWSPYYFILDSAGSSTDVNIKDIQNRIMDVLKGNEIELVKNVYFPDFRLEKD